ncbi:MAG: hypothetical protein IT195_02785 [Microthrixaceae bacterium]|nr:hypothetical protein [Microthrixaceae bacterium]
MADSDRSDRTGFVFCVRVGDWERPVFRYDELGDGIEASVVDDTPACLDHARPPAGFDTPRVLDDETYALAFDAWPIARNVGPRPARSGATRAGNTHQHRAPPVPADPPQQGRRPPFDPWATPAKSEPSLQP